MESNVIPLAERAAGKEKLSDIRDQVESRKAEEAEKYGKGDDGGDDVSSAFVRDCLRMNELGDGILFRELHRGKFIFNKAMDAWMIWAGHYWDIDTMELAKMSVENVVAKYIREVVRVCAEIRELDGKDPARERSLGALRDAFNQRISALRTTRRRNNCLGMAHTCEDAIAIHGEEIDRKPWLLACKNAVVDLRTGKARDGRPEDFLHKHAAAEWKGIDEPCPEWEKFPAQILEEDHPGDACRARAANHGTEFRELFYAEALPKKFMDLVSGHLAVLQATIIAFSVIHWEVSAWIRKRLGMNEMEDHWNTDKFLEKVFALNDEQADKLLHELAIDIVMKHASPVIRRALADRIGIDLAAEWAITEAYLKKKTIAEMLAMGKDLGIFEDDQVMTYTVGADDYLVVQNVYRNTIGDYCAVKLA